MKKKFLEIINKIQCCGAIKDDGICFECCSNESLAELIVQNNGVILPARIGQTVWGIFTPCGGCEDCDVGETFRNCDKAFVDKCEFDWDLVPAWGKDVFATKEDAEAVLERRNNASQMRSTECEVRNEVLLHYAYQQDKEKTRYDKIKELTVDEIAEYIDTEDCLALTDKICLEINPKQDCDCENENGSKCKECIKKWLMMTVKDGNEHENTEDN